MRIGIDVSRTAEPKTGLHSYARSLLEALARIDRDNQYDLHPLVTQCVPARPAGAFRPRQGNFRLLGRWLPTRVLLRRWAAHPDRERFFGDDPDVYFSPFHYAPRRHHRRLVCVFHDVAWQVHPEFSTEANTRLCTENFERARRVADRIITVSQHARSEMIARMGVPEAMVEAIPLAASPVFRPLRRTRLPRRLRRAFGSPAQWILFVGTIEPRKNLVTLVQAFELLVRRGHRDLKLMIAGGEGWKSTPLYERIDASGLRDRIHFAGHADDRELLRLYNTATVVACPSIYEGFGLPLIEAMSCGTPVVATRVASFPEVAGDAALFVEDPLDVEALAGRLAELLDDSDLRAAMGRRGLAQAARFSWERCARETLRVIEEVHSSARFRSSLLEFGRDERGAVSGWHETELAHGAHYRWTRERARVQLAVGGGELVVRAAAGTAGQVLEVHAQGRPLGACELRPAWQDFRIPLHGALAAQREVDLDLVVNALVPDHQKPGDTRPLGARVQSLRFRSA